MQGGKAEEHDDGRASDREDEDEDKVAVLFMTSDEEGEVPSQQEPDRIPSDDMSLPQFVGVDPSQQGPDQIPCDGIGLEGGGASYDELLAKAAYEYMLLHADKEKAAGRFCFFTAGPFANGRRGLLDSSLASCLNIHPPRIAPGAGVNFDFVEETEPTAKPMFSESYPIDSTNGEVLVFSVERANAGAVANVPLAPKLEVRTSCVAFVYSVVELRKVEGNKGRFRVALESTGGSASEENDFVVLSPGTFTSEEYGTIRAWTRGHQLHYDFGVAYEVPLTEAKGLALLAKLADLSGVDRPGFICAGSEQETDKTLDALFVWQRHGLVSSTVDDNASVWC